MRRTQPRNKGFNLVELVVAMGVLSFGIYGTAELLSASRHTATEGSRRLEATALGNLKLQEFAAGRSAVAAYAAATTGGEEMIYPPDAPRPFEQNPAYAWQAMFSRGEQSNKVNVEVAVHKNTKASSNNPPAAVVRGFVITPPQGQPAQGGNAIQ